MLLNVSVEQRGTTRVVTVAGEMDVSSVDQVRLVLDRVLAERPETFLLDLSGIDFCDSTGIHLVVQTHNRAKGEGVRFRVIPPQGLARRAFDICRIGEVVSFIEPDGG